MLQEGESAGPKKMGFGTGDGQRGKFGIIWDPIFGIWEHLGSRIWDCLRCRIFDHLVFQVWDHLEHRNIWDPVFGIWVCLGFGIVWNTGFGTLWDYSLGSSRIWAPEFKIFWDPGFEIIPCDPAGFGALPDYLGCRIWG